MTDLFPETLLVSRQGDRIYTTSLQVASRFHKRHTHVLRAIETIITQPNFGLSDGEKIKLVEQFNVLNFERVEYTDSTGRKLPMYEITHDGFALLVMGFAGPDALVWKIEFLDAFRAQERALAQLTARYAHVLDQVRPNLRPTVEGTEAGLCRSEIAERLGKKPGSVTYHRGQARRFHLLPQRGA